MLMHPRNVIVLDHSTTLPGAFGRQDADSAAGPCMERTGSGSIKMLAGTRCEVAGHVVAFESDAAITMPGSLAAGTDYAVWVNADGDAEASANFIAPPGAGDWRRIGGFHYAPGGNAAAQAGGDTTPQINPYSIWDVAWRPACPDPRGMTLVAGAIWADIYLCGVDHHVSGTSAHGVLIADGGSPPKVPAAFGGDGIVTYGNGNWWAFAETMAAHGKRLPSYQEFAALAYGTTEASSVGSDPVDTGLAAAYTSRWGVMQSTGCMYSWGREFSYREGDPGWGWSAVTDGRGSLYLGNPDGLVAVLFGGNWSLGSNSGSRSSAWYSRPWSTNSIVGARGVSDHLKLA